MAAAALLLAPRVAIEVDDLAHAGLVADQLARDGVALNPMQAYIIELLAPIVSSTPEAGKSYWMAFSNKGRIVKRGDRVNVVIGQFHADGLAVD